MGGARTLIVYFLWEKQLTSYILKISFPSIYCGELSCLKDCFSCTPSVWIPKKFHALVIILILYNFSFTFSFNSSYLGMGFKVSKHLNLFYAANLIRAPDVDFFPPSIADLRAKPLGDTSESRGKGGDTETVMK